METRENPSPLESADADLHALFEGLANQELDDFMVNRALKIAHPQERCATFQVYDSKAFNLEQATAYRMRYEIFSDQVSKGKFECLFNIARADEESEDYCLEVEDVKSIA